MARPSAPRRHPRARRDRPEHETSDRSARSLEVDLAARAFGARVLVGAPTATFGGRFASLR